MLEKGVMERGCIMQEFLSLLAFGAGTFCLGGGLSIALIFALASRYSDDSGEVIVAGVLALAAVVLAATFFYLAL